MCKIVMAKRNIGVCIIERSRRHGKCVEGEKCELESSKKVVEVQKVKVK